jgi:hypothetical protein
MKKKNNDVYVYILIFVIIFLLFLFYLFDIKNIRVQKYLNKIYKNNSYLKKEYKNYINDNLSISKKNNIIIIDDFLNPLYYKFLKNQFDNKNFKSKDYYLRKASGLDFFNLHESDDYKGLLELYYSSEILEILGKILEKPIQRPPLSDNNASSLLIYSNKGDYIDWHKDYSIYYGDRYVVLLTLVNENDEKDNMSDNEFVYNYNNYNYKFKMKPNSLVIFKGSEVYHKSTSIKSNEKRILYSMVFCDICQEKKNIFYYIYEKIKNYILYT